jgi:hypothetical protein
LIIASQHKNRLRLLINKLRAVGHNIAAAMARLIPPVNYGMVEENFYRSGFPNPLNFPFLEQLQLKKILYVDTSDLDPQL